MTSEIRFSGVGAKPQGWDAYVAGYCKLFGDNTLTKNTNKTESLMIGIGYFVVGIVICIFVFLTCHNPVNIIANTFHIITISHYRGLIPVNICKGCPRFTEKWNRFMESTK